MRRNNWPDGLRQTSRPEGRAPGEREDSGFVLLLVLLVTALISVGATTLIWRARETIIAVNSTVVAAERRALGIAATNRVIFASYPDHDDPIKFSATEEIQEIPWSFGSDTVYLRVEDEGAKADLNFSPTELIVSFLKASKISKPSVEFAVAKVQAARQSATRIASLAAVLPNCERLGGGAYRAGRFLTVATRSSGISVEAPREILSLVPQIKAHDISLIRNYRRLGRSPLDDEKLHHIKKYIAENGGLYTISVTLNDGFKLNTLVIPQIKRPYVRTVQSIMSSTFPVDLCTMN